MKRMLFITGLVLFFSSVADAQAFSSGSTGADGPLDLTSGDRTVQLPPSGILNYTTVNIPAGRTLTFVRNPTNTPAIVLTQGNVNIGGVINVSSPGGRSPGPGGFYGGAPNLNGGAGPNPPGFGPCAGPQSDGSRNGRWCGPLSLVPIIGGSGGSGGSQCTFVGQSPYGGGAGGAVVIASSQSIALLSGAGIYANGVGVECPYGGAGGGSGGAIRLVANAINAAGTLNALGADPFGSSSTGNHGVVRLEAPQGALIFTGTSNPPAVLSAINPVIMPSVATNLIITSIGGYAVPLNPGQRFDTADMLLPSQLTDPINVVVQATNIPVGTNVNITFSGSPNAMFTPGTLSGTEASSTATLTISNLNRASVTYLFVSATFDLPSGLTKPKLARTTSKGLEQVSKVRIEAAPGAKSKYVFLRSNGSVIDARRVPQEVLHYFGQ